LLNDTVHAYINGNVVSQGAASGENEFGNKNAPWHYSCLRSPPRFAMAATFSAMNRMQLYFTASQ